MAVMLLMDGPVMSHIKRVKMIIKGRRVCNSVSEFGHRYSIYYYYFNSRIKKKYNEENS